MMDEERDGRGRGDGAEGEEKTPGYATDDSFFDDPAPEGQAEQAGQNQTAAPQGKKRPALWKRPEKRSEKK